ncbi:MAG: ferritin-like domain-containing protein [Candidatus Binataceae bacterium]
MVKLVCAPARPERIEVAVTTQIESRMILVLSFYREAELQGSRLLLKLMNHLRDGETQAKLTRHVADETRHAWLLTRRIAELGGSPRDIGEAGYQRQLGRSVGWPHDVIDLLALTLVAEERALDRYITQAEHPAIDAATREVFRAVSADEQWHIAWVRERLFDLAYERNIDEPRIFQSIARYKAAEERLYVTLLGAEAALA